MGLFGRAKDLIKGLGTTSEAEVQFYNVVCPAGHRVRGQRTEGYQALRCPACGEGVFVLPASPLPDPGPRTVSAADRRVSSAVVRTRPVDEGPIELLDADEATVEVADAIPHPDAEIRWQEDSGQDAGAAEPDFEIDAPPGEVPDASPSAPAPSPRPRRKVRPPTGRPAAEPAVAVAKEPRGRRRSAWRPLRLFAGVALVVAATIAFRVWRVHRQGLPQVAELGREEGIPALKVGDFDKAYQLLAPAKQAVEALGGQVEGADRIRQAADEASLYVNLSPIGLEEMLDEAARTNPKTWADRFESQYQGRGVVFDSRIRSTPETEAGRFEIDFVVLPTEDAGSFRAGGARPDRSARIDFAGFELFKLASPKAGDRVVFGARLAAFEFDAATSGWVVRLEPDSGFFVQFHEALESLGWPSAADQPVPAIGGEE